MFAATTVPCCRDRQSCSRSYSGVLVPSGQTSLLAAAGRVLLPNPERRAERPQQSSHSLANRHRAVRDRAAPHIRRPRRAWEQALALPFPADGEVADRLQSRTPELRRRAPTAALSVGYSVADACPARDVPRSRPRVCRATGPIISSICRRETPPGRSNTGKPPVSDSTVDSIPTEQAPPSRM